MVGSLILPAETAQAKYEHQYLINIGTLCKYIAYWVRTADSVVP